MGSGDGSLSPYPLKRAEEPASDLPQKLICHKKARRTAFPKVVKQLPGVRFSSEIYKIYPYADLGEAPFFVNLLYFCCQEFPGIHEAGEDQVVFFRDVS